MSAAPTDDDLRLDNVQAQMRKGVLDYCILLVIARGEQVYASDILAALKSSNLLVVEGTVYPLLSRLTRAQYLTYTWIESPAGPPRKYYSLTPRGREALRQMTEQWVAFTTSINDLANGIAVSP
jgi:PadR family transcriptional regulator PadR